MVVVPLCFTDTVWASHSSNLQYNTTVHENIFYVALIVTKTVVVMKHQHTTRVKIRERIKSEIEIVMRE